MSASTVFRSARALARLPSPIVKTTARAAFTISARSFKASKQPLDFIPATEVSKHTIVHGEVHKSSIPVTEEAPLEPAEEILIPMTQESYDAMTPTMKKMTIKGKSVVVTGGARGLGNNMAKACIEAGAANVSIFDANQENGDLALAELHRLTGGSVPCSFYLVDVRDGDAVNAATAAVIADWGIPDVVINSAGIADSNIPVENYDAAMFRRLIDINLTGTFLIAQAFGKEMINAEKQAVFVFIASMSGSIVNYPQEQSCYNASKAGVVMFGKSLAAEWAKFGIRVNCISPGYMDTALNNVPALDAQKVIWKSRTPQDRLGAVDDLNGLAIYLASDSSAYMTGSNVLIDGGYTLY